jgi:hypothetical protein
MTEPPFNPYDFANPITNMLLLADRAAEKDEIKYYLYQSAEWLTL